MAQPTPYNRAASFSNIQAQAPRDPLPGATVDNELNRIKVTLDEVLANLELVQRDDGALANESVGYDQLSAELSVGINPWTTWVTATAYAVGDTVFHGSAVYRAATAHTAGVFATDLGAGKWTLIIDLAALTLAAASNIANTPAGSISATTVQAAIDELAAEKAATSHTHPSSAITDSTAAGRALLSGANAAAQRTSLGLGALALQDSVPVTAINAQIAYTGIIEPAALATSVNDWAPTGIATASTIRLSASVAGVSVTGLLAPAVDGDIKILENVGTTYAVTLAASSASSAAANRFMLPRPVLLLPNQCVVIKYDLDGTTPRWRLMSQVVSQPPAGSFKNLRVFNVATVLGDTAPTTPNSEVKIAADSITLEDAAGDVYQARSVALTVSSATTGANALDAGTVANSTWYSIWVIFNPTTGTVAGLLSTSTASPTTPSGYTFKARVGWQRTNGSAQFNRIVQFGRRAQYVNAGTAPTPNLPIMASGVAGNVSNPTWAAAGVSAFVPQTASVLIGAVGNGATNSAIMVAPNAAYGAYTSTTNPPPVLSQSGSGDSCPTVTFQMILESTNIYWAAVNTGFILALGWEDTF